MKMWVVIGDLKEHPMKFRVLDNVARVHSAWWGEQGSAFGGAGSQDVTKAIRKIKKGDEIDLSSAPMPKLLGVRPHMRKKMSLTVIYKSNMEFWEVHGSIALSPMRGRVLQNCGKIHRAYFGFKNSHWGHHLVIDVTQQCRKIKKGQTLDLRGKTLKQWFGDEVARGMERKLTVCYKPKGKVAAGAIPVEFSAAKGSGGQAAVVVPGLPAGWEARVDPATGRTFYINHATQATTWEKPGGAPAAAPKKIGGGAMMKGKVLRNGIKIRLRHNHTGKNLKANHDAVVTADGHTGKWATWIVHRSGGGPIKLQNVGNMGNYLRITPKHVIDASGRAGPLTGFNVVNHGGNKITLVSERGHGAIGFRPNGKLKMGNKSGKGVDTHFVWSLVE